MYIEPVGQMLQHAIVLCQSQACKWPCPIPHLFRYIMASKRQKGCGCDEDDGLCHSKKAKKCSDMKQEVTRGLMLKLRFPIVVMLLMRVLAESQSLTQEPDLDLVEFFAGHAMVTSVWRAHGYQASLNNMICITQACMLSM